MPPISPAVAHFRAKKARADQLGDTAASEQARRALALALTEATISDAIESAPPLDAATVARLHDLIPEPSEVAEVGGANDDAA